MYSTWWTPRVGEPLPNLTDHDALNRDEATHRLIQADEEVIRPLDVETVMSSKPSVKYWYLHRPKQMAAIHKKSVTIQSLVRSWAVRRLIDRNGVTYTVKMAKRDAEKKEIARLAELSEEELMVEKRAEALAEAKRLERLRQREEMAKLAKIEEESRCYELERIQHEMLERRRLKEEEVMAKEETRKRLYDVESVAATIAASMAREREREEREMVEREEIHSRKVNDHLKRQSLLDAANAVALAPTLPVSTPYGAGIVVSYDKLRAVYNVRLEDDSAPVNDKVVELHHNELTIDDSRIFSCNDLVETPFGLCEVLHFNPHTGIYTCLPEIATRGYAFIQLTDVTHHYEEAASVILEHSPNDIMPDEIGLVSARIIDSRIAIRGGKKYVQYRLEIQTSNYGVVYCWKRYNMFRELCTTLRKEKGFTKKEIPDLPKRHILGNFSDKTVGERKQNLNVFLEAAVKAKHLQWGIKVDDKISVYKRRVKKNC